MLAPHRRQLVLVHTDWEIAEQFAGCGVPKFAMFVIFPGFHILEFPSFTGTAYFLDFPSFMPESFPVYTHILTVSQFHVGEFPSFTRYILRVSQFACLSFPVSSIFFYSFPVSYLRVSQYSVF